VTPPRTTRDATPDAAPAPTPGAIAGLTPGFTREEYVSPEVFAHEMRTVFATQWCFVGRAEQLAAAGDRLVADVGDESVLLVRDRAGAVRGWYNVCAHRGARLCETSGPGHGGAITCPYHAWSYSLEGRLVATPVLRDDAFDRDAIGLTPVRVEEWMGSLFVTRSAEAPPLRDALAAMWSRPVDLDRFDLGALRLLRVIVDEPRANWKVLVENYAECLHCPRVHPELVDVVPAYRAGKNWEPGRTDGGVALSPGRLALATRDDAGLPAIPSMRDMDPGVWGAFVYPNMLVDIAPTGVVLTAYVPRGPDHTTVVSYYLFAPEVSTTTHDIEPVVEFSDLVNRQDLAVCERVQRGVASSAFVHGWHTRLEDYARKFVDRYRADVTA
jgi:Rieske 2Fe-2S family protein